MLTGSNYISSCMKKKHLLCAFQDRFSQDPGQTHPFHPVPWTHYTGNFSSVEMCVEAILSYFASLYFWIPQRTGRRRLSVCMDCVCVCAHVCVIGSDLIMESKCQWIHFQTVMHLLFVSHVSMHPCRSVQGFICEHLPGSTIKHVNV